MTRSCLNAPAILRTYVPQKWSEEIPSHHKAYLLALAKEWNQVFLSDHQNRLLDGMEHLSVGLLRLEASGSIPESQLTEVLDTAFAGSGYIAL